MSEASPRRRPCTTRTASRASGRALCSGGRCRRARGGGIGIRRASCCGARDRGRARGVCAGVDPHIGRSSSAGHDCLSVTLYPGRATCPTRTPAGTSAVHALLGPATARIAAPGELLETQRRPPGGATLRPAPPGVLATAGIDMPAASGPAPAASGPAPAASGPAPAASGPARAALGAGRYARGLRGQPWGLCRQPWPRQPGDAVPTDGPRASALGAIASTPLRRARGQPRATRFQATTRIPTAARRRSSHSHRASRRAGRGVER